MKIAILGDAHFGARNDSPIFKKYFAKFYENVFFPRLKAEGITEVIQLGDFFDRRKYINFTTLDFIRKTFINPAKEQGLNIEHLLGNHDIYYKNTLSINASSQLTEHYKHFNVIDKPITLNYDGVKIDIVPWMCEENKQEIMDYIAVSDSDILCAHLELNGYDMYPGIPAHGGISDNIFAKYHTVFTGHYHTRSVNGNINYIGTPYEITWGDAHDMKGFAIFDTETKTYEFVENPYRLHHKIMYDDSKENYDTMDLSHLEETFIKIIVDTKDSIEMFDRFIDRLYQECKPHSIQITDLNLVIEDNDDLVDSIHTESPLSILMNAVTVPNTSDEHETKKLINIIYDEALKAGVAE